MLSCAVCIIAVYLDTSHMRSEFLCASCSAQGACDTMVRNFEWMFAGYMAVVTLSITRTSVVVAMLCIHWSPWLREEWMPMYTSAAAWIVALVADASILMIITYRLVVVHLSMNTYLEAVAHPNGALRDITTWPYSIMMIGVAALTPAFDASVLSMTLQKLRQN